MRDSQKIVVTKLFALRESNELMAHLASFEWDFQEFGHVRLVFGGESIECRYTAFGNQSGEPVVRLTLTDSSRQNAVELARTFDGWDGPVELVR